MPEPFSIAPSTLEIILERFVSVLSRWIISRALCVWFLSYRFSFTSGPYFSVTRFIAYVQVHVRADGRNVFTPGDWPEYPLMGRCCRPSHRKSCVQHFGDHHTCTNIWSISLPRSEAMQCEFFSIEQDRTWDAVRCTRAFLRRRYTLNSVFTFLRVRSWSVSPSFVWN